MLIHTAREAGAYLFDCWRDPDYGNDDPIVFDGCALRIRLEPGKGEADYKMLRAVRLLQRHLDLTYLLAKHGRLDGRLSETERERLGIVLSVRPGSTELVAGMAAALIAINHVLPAHWSLRRRGIVMAGVVFAVLAEPYVGHYASFRSATDTAQIAADANVKMAAHTDRTNLAIAAVQAEAQVKVALGNSGQTAFGLATPAAFDQTAVVLAQLADDDPSNVVAFALSDYVPWRPAFLSLAPYGGSIQWGDSVPLPVRQAKAVAKSQAKAATQARRNAKANGHPGMIETPWVTEVLHTHAAPGAMRLGLST